MPEGFPKLVVLTGPEEGQTLSLPVSGTVLIGRSDENQFQLADSSVSRQHATLIAREGKYFLRDEHSRNATILEEKKLAPGEEVSLNHLDEFRLGIYELRFVEKPFTETDIKLKKQQAAARPVAQTPPPPLERSITKNDVKPVEEKNPSAPESVAVSADEAKPAVDHQKENLEAESLIEGLLKEKANVEDSLPERKSRVGFVLVLLFVIMTGLAAAAYVYREPLQRLWADWRGSPPIAIKSGADNLAVGPGVTVPVRSGGLPLPSVGIPATGPSGAITAPTTQSSPTQTTPQEVSVLQATPTITTPPTKTGLFNVFLDVTTKPFPATIYFQDERLGLAPLKSNIKVESGKIYELFADYDLRDVHDIYRKKVLFKARPDSDVIEVTVDAEIGTLKIQRLPERVEFYLEGYYDYDKDKANPVKLTDIIYGKPIYLPYGKYVVELRDEESVAGSSNLITVIRYQREFTIAADNPTLELSVTDKDLKYFPAVIGSDPTNANVFYNGDKVGTTPFKGNLTIGKGQLKISKDGYFDKTIDIDMHMNSVYETTVTLETSKVGELLNKAKAFIHADQMQQAMDTLVEALKYGGSSKEKAEVYYMLGEGYLTQSLFAQAEPYYEKAKTEPDFSERATLGLAKVYLAQKDDSKAMTTVVQVLANLNDNTPPAVRSEANAVFKKISQFKSVIYIYSDPPGASVYLNDKKIAQDTPLILSDLSLGSYRIQIEKPGYQTYQTKQTLKISDFVVVRVRLTKENL